MKETPDISVHVSHLKPYNQRETPPSPQFDKVSEFFLEKRIPLPALDHPDEDQSRIEGVGRAVGHKLEPGRIRLHNLENRMRLRRYVPESDLECHALTATYRTKDGLHIASPESTTSRCVK